MTRSPLGSHIRYGSRVGTQTGAIALKTQHEGRLDR